MGVARGQEELVAGLQQMGLTRLAVDELEHAVGRDLLIGGLEQIEHPFLLRFGQLERGHRSFRRWIGQRFGQRFDDPFDRVHPLLLFFRGVCIKFVSSALFIIALLSIIASEPDLEFKSVSFRRRILCYNSTG